MNVTKAKKIDLNDRVTWVDPDAGISSGDYSVIEIITESGRVSALDDVIMIRNDAGSHAEVYVSELV